MQFRLLGPLEVESAGRILPIPRRRERCLLGILLLEVNQVVSVDRLEDLLWDGDPPPQARRTIQSHVSRIRAVLATTGRRDGVELVSAGDGYRLVADPHAVDANRFQWFIDRAATITDLPARTDELRAALALWRGPPLDNAATPRLRDRLCVGLEERRLIATEDLAAAYLALRREREILPELARVSGAHLDREGLAGLHMRALYQAGRKVDALAVYGRVRSHLAEEFGLDPGAELEELRQAILLDRLPVPAPPAGMAVMEGTPGGAAPTEAPPDRPAAVSIPVAVPRQLPASAAFSGRERQLHRLDELLARLSPGEPSSDSLSTVVICAIDGMAGVGKTALAVHWGHRVRDSFPDGQIYLDLRGFSSAPPLAVIEALARLLEGLGVPASQIPSDVDRAAAAYRSLMADRRVLLVLDDAASVQQVRPLLPGTGCFVVVTSRSRLDGLVARDGAHRVSLDALLPSESERLLCQLLGAGRVKREPQAAAELAALCGQLPLALRIAAANLAAHPTHRIADHVAGFSPENQVAALEVADDIQASVTAAFDLSYDRLPVRARTLFRLLGTVPMPEVTGAAAAALLAADAGQAARLLDTLASAGLVQERAAGRYSPHDLLRRYAAGRAEREDAHPARQTAQDRLYSYYLSTVEAAARLLYPEKLRLPVPDTYSGYAEPLPDRAAALTWLDAEVPNLVAVARHTAASGPLPVAWLVSSVMRGYFWLRRTAVVDWLAVALAGRAAADAAGEPAAQISSRLALGDAYQMIGEDRLAVEHYGHALRTSEHCAPAEYESAVLNNLGMAYERLGRLGDAADHYHRAIEVNRRAGFRLGEAVQLGNLGGILQAQGQLSRAAHHHRQAIGIHRELDSVAMHAAELHELGATYAAMGRYREATAHLQHALRLHQQAGSRAWEATTLLLLAGVRRDVGTPDHRPCHAALALARELGDHQLEVHSLHTLGTIAQQQGHHQAAIDHHHQALTILEQVRSPRLLAETLTDLAGAHLDLGQHELAETILQRALELATDLGLPITRARILTHAARLALSRSDPTGAVTLAEAARDLCSQTGYRLGQDRAGRVLAQARRQRGR